MSGILLRDKEITKTVKIIILIGLLVGVQVPLGPVSAGITAPQATCAEPHQDVATALSDLGAGEYIRMGGIPTGFSGGLYPSGSNSRPASHETAGLAQAAQVTPLDANGEPDPVNGKIVMVSVGMSNTRMEFGAFKTQASSDDEVNPKLVLINGAIPSLTSEYWVDPNADAWTYLFSFLDSAGVTAEQVQVAWVKQTRTGGGEFPAKAQVLQGDLQAIVRNLKTHFPNIKIAYLSSRIRAYTYQYGLSPEPLAYETGFAVKWLVESQINGNPELNYDPANGDVMAPYLSWGPYLWADGQNPRSDGLVWLPEDLTEDCTHPTDSGIAKVAQMLMAFFKNDPTAAAWFLENPPPPPPPPPPPTFQLFLPLAVYQAF